MKEIEFKRVNNDVNGNPRYACHFFDLLNEEEKSISNYSLACKRANKLGGKKYRGNDFGGGLVFQSYETKILNRRINELLNNK
jgi:hypothetical protein